MNIGVRAPACRRAQRRGSDYIIIVKLKKIYNTHKVMNIAAISLQARAAARLQRYATRSRFHESLIVAYYPSINPLLLYYCLLSFDKSLVIIAGEFARE